MNLKAKIQEFNHGACIFQNFQNVCKSYQPTSNIFKFYGVSVLFTFLLTWF